MGCTDEDGGVVPIRRTASEARWLAPAIAKGDAAAKRILDETAEDHDVAARRAEH